ncbi:hypothetical protein [Azospirillum argentinense]
MACHRRLPKDYKRLPENGSRICLRICDESSQPSFQQPLRSKK